jgi:predicted ATPase
MKEKLIIRNFGPIKSIELDLGKFTVLIGEQATGKSTVAKVLAMCRYFSYIINNDPYEQPFNNGLLSWGLVESSQSDTYIFYDCNHYSLKIERRSIPFEIERTRMKGEAYLYISELVPKSDEFKHLQIELKKITPKPNDSNYSSWTIPTSFFLNDVAKVMDNPFYLPTERGLQSIFSLGRSSIQNISDSLFNQLAKLDQAARSFTRETFIEPLGIIYKNVDGKGFIRKENDEKFFSLFSAASGYQSTIPVTLIIKYYWQFKEKSKTFIVEEPELNLFPSAQQKLIQFFVESANANKSNFLLTTHSPYILAAINNLIYAYKVGQTEEKAVSAIVPRKYWLNSLEVSAYRLLPDGTALNIVDTDLGEIIVEELDQAGKEINSVYDEILAVKFRENEESE